jgi:uncharacterized protein YciI
MFGSYCDNVKEKREPYRQKHLDHLKELKTKGFLEKAGPTKDLAKIFAIFVAEGEAEVRAEIERDPYWQNGIWTEYTVWEWIDAI